MLMEPVKTQFILHPEQDQECTGKSDCQSQDIDQTAPKIPGLGGLTIEKRIFLILFVFDILPVIAKTQPYISIFSKGP